MASLALSPTDALRFEHTPPSSPAGATFVGFNALTGDWNMWESTIGARLREAGHGTLLWNYRGQNNSPVSADAVLDADLIAGDAAALLAHCTPSRPILVGLSIGGLFAARALLAGVDAAGLVLINTLRRPGPRLSWINDAVTRAAEIGGLDLVRDLYAPLLFDEAWLADNRAGCLSEGPYQAIDRSGGAYRLLRDNAAADWDLPYEALALPALVVTGRQDRVFRDPADVERLAARLPAAQRIDLDDAGHMVPVERPERCAGALIEFAARVAGG